MVIYHGKKNWNIPSNLGDILNGYDELPERLKGYVPNFEFLLYDISRHSDEEIKGTAQLKILLTLFRDLNTGDVQKQNEAIFRSIHYLNELENKQTAVGYLETLMRYIFTVARDFTTEDMEQMIHEIETTQLEGSEVVMTLADILRKEGIEKGIDIGETKALSNMAIIQLTSKFGALPKELKNEIAKADKETLQVILMNIFNLESIDDVKRYLH